MNSSKTHDRYEEGRRFPRIPVSVPVTVSFGKNQTLEAMIYDISPDGLQIRCNRESAQLLHPRSERIDVKNRPSVETAFTLTIKNKDRKVAAKCHVCYMIFLEEAESEAENAALGLNFTALKGRSGKFVNQYLFKK
jgi:hypothetical protein